MPNYPLDSKENTLNKIYIYIFEYYQIHQNLSQTDHLQINGNLLKSIEIKDFRQLFKTLSEFSNDYFSDFPKPHPIAETCTIHLD